MSVSLSLFELSGAVCAPEETVEDPLLERVRAEDRELERHFRGQMQTDSALSRGIVSFQSSKGAPRYRWFKFKEAFSPTLVESFLAARAVGRLLDPFAGSGTALWAGAALGWECEGIEVLPLGRELIATRAMLESEFSPADFERLRLWAREKPWRSCSLREKIEVIPITHGAYPPATHDAIEAFLGASLAEDERVRRALKLALLCVLESVSFTRKDGQYLRWDYRSGRKQGARPFDKGRIWGFDDAITLKLEEMWSDLHPNDLEPTRALSHPLALRLHAGSCLDVLPQLPGESFDAVVTSPPYCNRYDYTRTYALELALLGASASDIGALRQQMLSCTVENRAKDLLRLNPAWEKALEVAGECALLRAVCDFLDARKEAGLLNNAGIARMVRGYFVEMACVVAECARVLKPGAPMWMVNDNVRYCGASISADLILSFFAEHVGFEVENIAVLPGNKGNSSQQMGAHGRDALRKCVYVWRKR